ncbi:MAG: LL-diaminopimelate aminotransferase [Candidatus Altiarchaeales archaeon HGW-Altiarchaeales-1]|nr:MAG: LL-diaminopimelate aminotransferase [Candidatus Altiarchaeales archaeon HGW-Altiarchaeales-1]
MNPAKRIQTLPPYLFAEVDKKVAKAKSKGKDIINLSIGDPDLPTPKPVVEKLYEAAKNPDTHHYPSYVGMKDLRLEISNRMKKRFNADFSEDEICVLIGSKEGIAHLPLGIINPGDYGIYPDPGYPVYRTSIMFAGGKPVQMPLKQENKFLPDMDELNKKIKFLSLGKGKTKLMFLNYPNNPTSATIDLKFLKEVVEFAIENEILICYDNAYSEMTFDNYVAPTIFEIKEARETAIEIFSFSKTYNMTGWRIGFAVGKSENLNLLKKVKENFDSGVFNAIQIAAIEALRSKDVESEVRKNMKIFEERRNVVCEKLEEFGAEFEKPKATFYIWVKVNKEKFKVTEESPSMKFCDKAIEKGVVLTPGVGFGEYGEGFVRIAITQSRERITEGIERIKEIF